VADIMMNPVSFSWPEGKSGALTTSWDDGTCHDRRLVDILNRNGLKATWNLNARRMLAEPAETVVQADEARSLYAGHEIACHAYSHPHLEEIPEEAVKAEMIADRRHLEAIAGYPVRGMALPYGSYDARVVRLLRECGILHSRTTAAHDRFGLPGDFLEWHPTCHHRADLAGLWTKFVENRSPTKLFYLWGHSYEFPRDDNWETIEEFAATAGAAADIWKATNMEVALYVAAWRQLWCSLDLTSVYNPSATTVWFHANGKLRSCAAGETLPLPD
jgi:peptidoglycan/xylan/chitin deacetylase (PgdA/CDA1 family)